MRLRYILKYQIMGPGLKKNRQAIFFSFSVPQKEIEVQV